MISDLSYPASLLSFFVNFLFSNALIVSFAVDSKLNIMKRPGLLYSHMADKPGASHGDDVCYVFRCGLADDTYDGILRNSTDNESKISLQTIEYMTKMFTNFAKYG